jgi:DNA-binding MarR family transcriptional regulator
VKLPTETELPTANRPIANFVYQFATIHRMSVSNRDVRIVQTAYPQIYFACHTRHVRRASTATQLSATDSTLLAHLDEDAGVRATVLAKHLGLAASTLSAAIARLAALGYVEQRRDAADGRAISLLLSAKGAAAMQASSVLESARVKTVLARLNHSERKRALGGLALLARAARSRRS